MPTTPCSLPVEFREALLTFSKFAITKFKEVLRSGVQIPVMTRKKIVSTGGTSWSTEDRHVPIWGLLIFKCDTAIKDSLEYQACLHLMAENSVIARHLDQLIYLGFSGAIFDSERVLFGFITEQLGEKMSPEFDESSFTAVYNELETFLIADEVQFEIWAPIENLECSTTPITISPDIEIVQPPPHVFERIFPVGEFGYELHQVANWKWVLHIVFKVQKLIGAHAQFEPAFDKQNMPGDVLTSLRLLKGGRVRSGPVAVRPKQAIPIPSGVTYRGMASPLFPLAHPDLKLNQEDLAELTRIFSLIRGFNSEKYSALALALRRINLSYDRFHQEDRLIDQMIAFEALYLADMNDDDRGELRFRIALRVAYFLESGKNRRNVFKEMKRAYDIRSAIVHGGTPELPSESGSQLTLNTFTDKIEDYLRRSLVKFLELVQQPDVTKQLVQWDDLLFPGMDTLS